MIRVLVVDDHAVVRSGLHLLLDAEEDIKVVGEAGTAAAHPVVGVEATNRGGREHRPGKVFPACCRFAKLSQNWDLW